MARFGVLDLRSLPSRRGRTWRSSLCLVALLVAMMATVLVEAKPKKYNGNSAKTHWKKENECLKSDCKAYNTDENEDCLARCVSPACHAEVYAEDPLEPGEVDKQRSNKFNSCVRSEQEQDRG
mmetsp:Transcript_26881/g.40706  ORF Transcript_26881/g.40706 Transcript_26881/m.40706 type:complete len:123 (-) Transcript_26881:147-515(-)